MRALLGILLLATSLGCGGTRALVGAGGVQRLTAADETSGVTIVATTSAWSGIPPSLTEEVTVIHVLVANAGKTPILLAPGDIELEDRRGFRYDLLDPGATFHSVEENAKTEDERPETPSDGAYGRDYAADYDVGRDREFQWFEAHGDIAELALPWGVLQPGTQMRGYLYFEPLAANANGGALTWHLGTPTHQPVVDAVFEFAVAR